MQSQVRVNGSGEGSGLVQSHVRLSRVPEKVPVKVWEALFGAEPGQVQQGSGAGSGEGSGEGSGRAGSGSIGFRRRLDFGAEPGQVQQGSGEGSGEGLGGARSGSTGLRRRLWIRSGRLWCRARSGSTGALRRPWCKAKSGPTGFGEGCREGPREGFGMFWESLVQGQVRFQQVQQGFQRLASQQASERFNKNKMLQLLGIPPKLISKHYCIY